LQLKKAFYQTQSVKNIGEKEVAQNRISLLFQEG